MLFTAVLGGIFSMWMTCISLGAWEKESLVEAFCFGLAGFYSAAMVAFALLDARSRFQEYKRAKDLFLENGFQKRVARLFRYSRCQRDALRVAAKDLGILGPLNQYYEELGYHWYHILPDVLFRRPAMILSLRYWRKTLFEPHYRSLYFLW